MNARFSRLLLAWMLFAGGCVVPAGHAQPDEILLNHSRSFGRNRQNPVRFSHGQHMSQFDCLDCHHRYENKKNVLDPDELEQGAAAAQCLTCHNPGSNCRLQGFFHKQCLSCHIAQQQAGKPSGPRMCIDCHPHDRFTADDLK